MKRNYLIVLAIFSVLSLCVLFQLYAEQTTLEKFKDARAKLESRKGDLNGYNIVLLGAITVMGDEEDNWDANEEDITENRIDYASADLWGLGGAVLKQAMDMQHRRSIALDLGSAIGAVETAKTDADNAQSLRDTAWTEYETALAAARKEYSPEEIGFTPAKGPNALPVSYPDISITCPNCSVKWSGSGIGGLADHITSCSVKGHTNLSGDLVSDPLPHFTCETCPLAHQHYTFACRGKCGELFRQPTYRPTYPSSSPESQGAVSYVAIFFDHGVKENGLEDKCPEDVSGPLPCNHTRYSCRTPTCPNDTNHLKDAPCGEHTVLSSEFSAHEALPDGHARKGQCTYTHNFDGTWYQCIVMITHKCDLGHGSGLADQHDFNPDPSLVYPSISPEPEPVASPPDNTPNCPDCTSHCSPSCNCSNSGTCNGTVVDNTPNCSYCTDGCSSCQTPTTVSCARSACSESVSSSTEHRVPPCSSCGKGYWTCGDYATYSANQHRVRTCRRLGCGNTWQRCISSTPACNVASGKGCWAADP